MHVLRKPRVEALQKKLINREIGRREFMAAAATAGLVPVASSMVPAARAAEGDMIHYFTWSAYEVPELHQAFVEQHGRSPNWSLFGNAEDGLQKIRAGLPPTLPILASAMFRAGMKQVSSSRWTHRASATGTTCSRPSTP